MAVQPWPLQRLCTAVVVLQPRLAGGKLLSAILAVQPSTTVMALQPQPPQPVSGRVRSAVTALKPWPLQRFATVMAL